MNDNNNLIVPKHRARIRHFMRIRWGVASVIPSLYMVFNFKLTGRFHTLAACRWLAVFCTCSPLIGSPIPPLHPDDDEEPQESLIDHSDLHILEICEWNPPTCSYTRLLSALFLDELCLMKFMILPGNPHRERIYLKIEFWLSKWELPKHNWALK